MRLEVRRIFLDISKVWHDGRIFKMSQNIICVEMINILVDFQSGRKQGVVFNDQYLP